MARTSAGTVMRKKANSQKTVVAGYTDTGISLGIYGRGYFISLENAGDGKLRLLIDDDDCKQNGIEIIHCSAKEYKNTPPIEEEENGFER